MKLTARYQFCGSLALLIVCAFSVLSRPYSDSDIISLRATLTDARQLRERFAYKEALQTLDRAARYHKNSADLLAEYGYIWLDTEETERAISFFDRALKMQPTSERAIAGRAAADLMRRDFVSAESRLRDFVSKTPQSSLARVTLARVYFENDRTADAEYEAARVLANDAGNEMALNLLAFIKATQRDASEARRLARRALDLTPNSPSLRRLLSQYLDGQLGYAQQVPIAARRYYLQGKTLKQAGKINEAITELEAALKDEPLYYRALIALGDIWLRQEEYERAAAMAQRALKADADGAAAHLILSYANAGIQERARIALGAKDFTIEFFNQTAPLKFNATAEIFPNYRSLSARQQFVVDAAVAPFATFLPTLTRRGARHYLISFDERASDIKGVEDVPDERTFDGRYFASLRGIGGRVTVSGLEYLEMATRAGYNTVAHEFAHQVHMNALAAVDLKRIRKLYENAVREERALDYYAAADEYEYFAQGYEAYVSLVKRPSTGATARHTRSELLQRDPDLFNFIEELAGKLKSPVSGSL